MWPQGNSGNNGMPMNVKLYIMPLFECVFVAPWTLCCVPGILWNGVFKVFFLSLFRLSRPKLSFWRHVVFGSRTIKRLNRSPFALTGQSEFLYIDELYFFDSQVNWARPPLAKEWSLGNLSMQRFWATEEHRKCTLFRFDLSSHYHICIFKFLCASRDD